MIIGLVFFCLFLIAFFDPAPKTYKQTKVKVSNKEWKKELHGE